MYDNTFVQENSELRRQLQSSEREEQTAREQLKRKEAELTRAEEREQQQMRQMRQRVSLYIVWGVVHVVCVTIDVL